MCKVLNYNKHFKIRLMEMGLGLRVQGSVAFKKKICQTLFKLRMLMSSLTRLTYCCQQIQVRKYMPVSGTVYLIQFKMQRFVEMFAGPGKIMGGGRWRERVSATVGHIRRSRERSKVCLRKVIKQAFLKILEIPQRIVFRIL